MRQVFYGLLEIGDDPNHIIAGRVAMCGYEGVSGQNDPPMTTFKGLPLALDRAMAVDEMRFMRGNEIVGVIHEIS